MKFLLDDNLTLFTQELTESQLGKRVINGRIEAYTCKRAGSDKKYAHNLSEKFTNEVDSQGVSFENSPYSKSPLGDFHATSTRRLLIDLILTLNASFPDYDFGSIKPAYFRKIPSSKIAANRANEQLSELAQKKQAGFLNEMWKAIDEVIVLSECEVYSFRPEDEGDEDADPFAAHGSEGLDSFIIDEHEVGASLWSFNYFFVNKHLKRILLFTCVQSCLKGEYIDENGDVDYQGTNSFSIGGGYKEEDDEGYGYDAFEMDVDVVDQPAVSIATA
mmetsp:Transcript_32163/g.47301  ORF Transcript_32163/g.47301 Transcript_32163/m.47301 type:complete len:275 (-) Transcript_32163:495-1319(-)|eukprot:CAMPEP_0195538342 /NCGR_PEP_ID=MMETSP0794_2-20130614/49473_1 /TAXON_ID=515487 /ORGANISM="Stephanopyxis turris, Strain CCMP 815" /LENGTH=274 /DNA_ID=CAMNT_0040672313 /DNA_START=805 /DNA_END=1629 /DNA_ORIENTATION=-